jgi:DNA replication protein DnaC
VSVTEKKAENEIMAEARAAKARKDAAAKTPEPSKGVTWQIAAIGAGIGSAALAAAVLYANRNSKKRK